MQSEDDYASPNLFDVEKTPNAEANARLAAAAPEMYAELKIIFERDGYESIKIILDKINEGIN